MPAALQMIFSVDKLRDRLVGGADMSQREALLYEDLVIYRRGSSHNLSLALHGTISSEGLDEALYRTRIL